MKNSEKIGKMGKKIGKVEIEKKKENEKQEKMENRKKLINSVYLEKSGNQEKWEKIGGKWELKKRKIGTKK